MLRGSIHIREVSMFSKPLISAYDALSLVAEPDVRFVDATWFMPSVPTNAYEAYLLEHIPGAVYFDIDKVAETSIKLPHTFPSANTFEKAIGNLGILETDRVVAYDRGNFTASARAWWLFESFGHQNVSVLDGGLPAWKRADGEVTETVPEVTPQIYRATAADDAVILREEVVAALPDSSVAIVDARSPGRFNGTEPEPRPGLRGGHIPGSLNMYYADVLHEDGTMKNADEVSALLDSLSVSADQQIVSTCGSGVTAAIILLAIYQFRQDGLRLYDGSWTEWALHPDSPV